MINSQKNKNLIWMGVQLVYFTLLTLIFTRPLLSKISTHVAGNLGDNLYFIWQIGWFKQALFDLGQFPLHSHLLNFPYGYNLAVTEIAPLQLLFAMPFAIFDQFVLGYNFSMLLSFILAGMFMSAWIHQLSANRLAGLLAGSAYAFLPYHMAHFLSGHLNISAIQWFPLFFWGLFSILIDGKRKSCDWVRLAIGLSGIALSSQYYLYSTLLISAFMLVVYFLFLQRSQMKNSAIWRQFFYAGALSLPALAVGIIPYLRVHQGTSSIRTLEDVMTFSASPTDFLLPFARHFLWGEWVWENFPRDLWNEATLYLGIFALILAGIGYAHRKVDGHEYLFKMLGVGFVASIILAMGTNLTWMEKPVRVIDSSIIAEIFRNEEGLIFLPGYFLFKYLPFYSIMRAWMRLAVFSMVFCCAGAGLGLNWILGRTKKLFQIPVSIFAILIILMDFFVKPNNLSEVKPRAVDLWLAEQPYGGQVQLPFKQSFEEYSLFYTLYNQKPLLGLIRTFPSNRFFELDPLLKNFPDETSVNALREIDVSYIILDENHYSIDDDFIHQCETLGIDFLISLEGQAVFALPVMD